MSEQHWGLQWNRSCSSNKSYFCLISTEWAFVIVNAWFTCNAVIPSFKSMKLHLSEWFLPRLQRRISLGDLFSVLQVHTLVYRWAEAFCSTVINVQLSVYVVAKVSRTDISSHFLEIATNQWKGKNAPSSSKAQPLADFINHWKYCLLRGQVNRLPAGKHPLWVSSML